MKQYLCALGVLLLSGAAQPIAQQQAETPRAGGPPPSIEERVNGLRKLEGFFPLYWD